MLLGLDTLQFSGLVSFIKATILLGYIYVQNPVVKSHSAEMC